MRPRLLAFTLALPTLLLAGCDAVEPELESEPEPEPEPEIPPQPLPLEDTPTAYGMLRVANELGFSDLDQQVGLDRRAAQSIIAYRAGPDEYLGTADDRYVGSLAQLDALHWLGEANLWTLQQHALREGFVPAALPAARCAPALAEAIDQCLRFTEQAAGGEVPLDERLPSCLEKSEPACPSSAFFAHAGLTDHDDPMLGYHALLCGQGEALEQICELGVAGMAAHLQPHCDALYDDDQS